MVNYEFMDSDNLQRKIAEGSHLVVLLHKTDMWSRKMERKFAIGSDWNQFISNEGYQATYIEQDQSPEVGSFLGVDAVTTVVGFKEGKEVGRHTGNIDVPELNQKISDWYS